jgi:hypothetical protein
MSKVIADITMSLDGYVTGPSADSQHGLGDVDELHAWVAEQGPGRRAAFVRCSRRRRINCPVDGWCCWRERTLERVMTTRRQSRLRSSLRAIDRSAHGRRWAVPRCRLWADSWWPPTVG